ncbi:hypothetical protein [Streptomyces sp. NPDC018352]|uniref:hypothetical protein n=1 Tax=Streptomyces sp. NPDC018352 TaxID=3157194 RepID=UPI0033C61F35
MQHPDFELYDNVGRTSEQIAAAHFGIATRDDLLRWARRDAEQFLTEHPLPAVPLPAPDAAPYLAALAAAQTPAEVSAITQHLLDAAQSSLSVVSDLLVSIARWGNRHRGAERGAPAKMLLEAASRSLAVIALADQADLAVLRDEYDPAPNPAQKTTASRPPAPPASPPAGPTPSR